MYPIAFITTCKGRLHHIKQTLATIAAESPAEIILVDYACPDNTGDWVEENFPEVKVIRVNDDPGFCLPRARNIGAANSSAPWLCFIDADIRISSGWLEWMQQNLNTDCFYLVGPAADKQLEEAAGTVICTRAAFEGVGGYDEVFRGWGGEDTDLYTRLAERVNARAEHYPAQFVNPISHADDERTTFHAIKNVKLQSLINRCYIRTKAHLYTNGVRDIPFETRQHLLQTISDSLTHSPSPPKTFTIRLHASNLVTGDGKRLDLLIEVTRRRRFGFFGPRQTSVRTLSQADLHGAGDHPRKPLTGQGAER
ncbi:glycosyltransferase family 2 protein [Pseudomonas sp. LS44]|uniref:glycosyltransferase family 2 protein n=1 Tax=Pseudomonas sp. LS44 TaxID=1357074 RepID=UPI00215A603B|nr:glycosyltransferase family A protein [Pseudomonas sp. LS44]UVE18086.1 glycosyltransferase family 2 protein [Pseudomonas sp. LS44]